MGRRSQHTPEELREIILSASRKIVEQYGFKSLSAREIAREIGYAPGTLYNMFRNLDEILLRVEARILTELDDHIERSIAGLKGAEALTSLAQAYIDFAFANSNVWELIQFHHPTIEKAAPDWYLDCPYTPMQRIESLLAHVCDTESADEAARNARQMWSVIHALVNTALNPKLGVLPQATTTWMVESLVVDIVSRNAKPRARRHELVRAASTSKKNSATG